MNYLLELRFIRLKVGSDLSFIPHFITVNLAAEEIVIAIHAELVAEDR